MLGVSVELGVRAYLRPFLVFGHCKTILPLKIVTQCRFATPKPLKTRRCLNCCVIAPDCVKSHRDGPLPTGGRMGHGTHHRDRSRTGASTAGHGRRLMWVPTTQCGSSTLSSTVSTWLGPGSNERSRKRHRAPGVRSLRLAEAVHLRVSEPGAVQPSAWRRKPTATWR